jgi:hypothetical protein
MSCSCDNLRNTYVVGEVKMNSKNRHILNLNEKMQIVDLYNAERLSVRELAERFKIGKTQDISVERTKNWRPTVSAHGSFYYRDQILLLVPVLLCDLSLLCN